MTPRIAFLAAVAALTIGVAPAWSRTDDAAEAGRPIREEPATLREALEALLRAEHEAGPSEGWLGRVRSALGDPASEERDARIERLRGRVNSGVEELRRERAERTLSKQEARLLERMERVAHRLDLDPPDPPNAADAARPPEPGTGSRKLRRRAGEVRTRDESEALHRADVGSPATPDVGAAPDVPTEPALGGMSFSLLVFSLGLLDSAISGLRARRPGPSIASRRHARRSGAGALAGKTSRDRSSIVAGEIGRGAACLSRGVGIPGVITPTSTNARRQNGHGRPSWIELGPPLPSKRPNGFGFPICSVCGIPVVRVTDGEYGVVSVDGIADRVCPECTREFMHRLLENNHRVGIGPL